MQNIHQRNTADASVESSPTQYNKKKACFVGSGIASLASAAFLIRDGLVSGDNIHIFEELKITGGSLDGALAKFGYLEL